VEQYATDDAEDVTDAGENTPVVMENISVLPEIKLVVRRTTPFPTEDDDEATMNNRGRR
jgi:hypothetical protein